MQPWNTLIDVLDFAIENETQAAKFYTELAKTATQPWMREVLTGFAREEHGHRQKLEHLKATGKLKPSDKVPADLKLADYIVEMTPTPNMDYQRALVVAMHREKAAFRLYTDLAEQAHDTEIREAFLALAQEEAKHKLRFELEYDDLMNEN
jgi:rubrerythrin